MSSPLVSRSTLGFLQQEWRFLSFGLLVAFWSSPGQTYVISLFGAQIREEFGLSHGDYGTLYMLATLASAVCLIQGGRLVDRLRLAVFTRWVVLGIALAAAAFSQVSGPITLLIGLFFLRFTGQGLMSHIATTAMARRYRRERGRALAVAALGFSIAEAVLPPLVFWLLTLVEWRLIWIGFAVAATLTLQPLLSGLLRRTETQDGVGPADLIEAEEEIRHWTRGEMLRDRRFYLLVPLVSAQSAIITGLFFHQVHLVSLKGWSLSWWGLCFLFFALASIAGNLLAGFLVDRFSGRRLAPYALCGFSLGLLIFAVTDAPFSAALVMILLGLSAGSLSAIFASMWAELYGTAHLGAIRALATALMVFASALGPVIMGLALDRNSGIPVIALGSLVYVLIACGMAAYALRREGPAAEAGV